MKYPGGAVEGKNASYLVSVLTLTILEAQYRVDPWSEASAGWATRPGGVEPQHRTPSADSRDARASANELCRHLKT